nr:reverse transcriptase domain-containing protein [Tanacetum cinerariifolium]
MADNHTMEELLQEPTEGYGEAIDLVNKFVNQFFPPLKTTYLKNEISRFTQRFEETFGEAWERFKEMLRACPHHEFTELAQIDTFYNGLNDNDQDSLNAAAGGNLLSKTTREALQTVENKLKVRYSRNKPNVSRMNTTSKDNASKSDDRIDKLADQISTLVDIFAKKIVTPASNQSLTSSTLSSNTIPNPMGEMKSITTRSGITYDGPSIPTPKKVAEQETKEITDKEQTNFQGSIAHIQPPVTPILESDVPKTLPKPNIPYPSRLNDQKLHEKATNQMEKFFQIFQDFHFDISFTDALILMPKFTSTIKSLLINKDKLFELAKIPLNENCSAMLLKKLPKNLGDPGKFLIPCDFLEIGQPQNFAWEIADSGSVKSVFKAWEQGLSSFETSSKQLLLGSLVGSHRENMIDFYGILQEVLELEYLGENKRVLVFKCDWFRVDDQNGLRIDKESKVISVNASLKWYQDQPYILASQAKQVFYAPDIKLGKSWLVVDSNAPRALFDVPLRNKEIYQDQELHLDLIDDLNIGLPSLARGDVPLEVVDESKIVREDDIQESRPKVLRKRQAYMQSEDQEIQKEVQTESGDHEDYSEDDHEVNSSQTETEIGSTSHGTSVTRKETRALNEAKKRRLEKGKLVFEIDECTRRIIGQDSQRFITKGGCLVREYGLFDGTTWKKHPDFLKTDIISKCMENSTFDGKCKRSVDAIDSQLGNQHKNRQYRLHVIYFKFPTHEEALVDPPSGIELPDWVKLCDKFASEKFQMLNEQNKKNRSFNLIPPAVGTKSVARRIDMKKREGKKVTAIDSYEIAHYCEKKKKMVSEEAVAVLNKLRSEEAAGSGTPAEICFKLLKRVPGHLRGRSAPKKEILAMENLRVIVESEKNKSAALVEKLKEVAVEQDEMKKCMGLMMKEIQRLSKLVPDKSHIDCCMILAESYLADSIKCLMPYALGMPGNIGSTMSRWWIETSRVTGSAANRPMHVILHV